MPLSASLRSLFCMPADKTVIMIQFCGRKGVKLIMKKLVSSVIAAAVALTAFIPNALAAESWRDAFVTRLMKLLSTDNTYSEVVLTDLDKNGIPEAFVLRTGMNGGISDGFTLSGSTISSISVPNNVIGDCLTDITVYQKEGRDIFVGKEVPRYSSVIQYYKLEFDGSALICTPIRKIDVSPYPTIPYVDMYGRNFMTNGYPNRTLIKNFIDSYNGVNILTADKSQSRVTVDGKTVEVSGYSVNGSNYYKIRDIAMILRSTPKKFNVEWDSSLGSISVSTGVKYVIEGGELSDDNSTVLDISENVSPIYVDGKESDVVAYTINEANYFKIRDLANIIGFNVSWDADTDTVAITTE